MVNIIVFSYEISITQIFVFVKRAVAINGFKPDGA